MDVRHSSRRLAPVAIALTLGLCLSGCQSGSPFSTVMDRLSHPFSSPNSAEIAKKNAQNMPLAQGMEINWTLKTAREVPGQVMAGKSMVGPDGAIEMGPYGTCKVAGLTINQAAQAAEKHMNTYVPNAGVQLSTVVPLKDGEVAWRPSNGKNTVAQATPGKVASGKVSPGKAGTDKDVIRPVDFQVTEPKDEIGKGKQPVGDIQPVVRRQKHYQNAPPMEFPAVVPLAPGELNPVLLPSYVVGPPDVLQIESLKGLLNQPVRGPHLIRPDGTVGIGAYGSAQVAGLTIDQAKEEIAKVIHSRLNKEVVKLQEVIEGLSVDVLAYNSKVYYVITDGGGYGEQVVRVPVTGNETVLDAISQINGLPPVASKKHIWVARRNPGMAMPVAPGHGHGGPVVAGDAKLPVDWIGITQRGEAGTNYQILPGDRIYVQADRWRTADAFLQKVLSPFERILGVTLLGSQTVNSLKTGTTGLR